MSLFKSIHSLEHNLLNNILHKEDNEVIIIFNDFPTLTINEICKLSDIKVPKKYVDKKDEIISKNKHYLKDKDSKYVKKLEFVLRHFVEKYYSQDNLTKDDNVLLGYIIDFLYKYGPMGFRYNDYFDYELYNKDEKVAKTFLNGRYRDKVCKICNNKKYKNYLNNKALFNKKFSKYIKREWLDTTNCSFEEFEKFIKKYPVHFGKPIDGTGGYGSGLLEYNNEDLKKLFRDYKKKELIIESVVKQHKEMAKFNSSSLNTVRVYSLLCADGEVRILLGIIRFGRMGNTVDNFHCGGITALINPDTGEVITDAINRSHILTKVHPDSNIEIKGFKIPCYDKLVNTVKEAAKILPEVRHIGWDVAITENGDIELIEGNFYPNFDATQTPDQIGKKYVYEKYIKEIEKMNSK